MGRRLAVLPKTTVNLPEIGKHVILYIRMSFIESVMRGWLFSLEDAAYAYENKKMGKA